MNNPNILSYYEYIIPSTSVQTMEAKWDPDSAPLIKLTADFANGRLLCDADWLFMKNAGDSSFNKRFNRNGRFFMENFIYPALPADLTKPDADGLLFTLEDSNADEFNPESCTGFLVIDNAGNMNECANHNWNLSFYLYDVLFKGSEIKFKIPVYINSYYERNNETISKNK